MKTASGIAQHEDWRVALQEAAREVRVGLGGDGPPDLALFFASPAFADDYPELVKEARAASGARLLAGCSGQGVIGREQEVEGEPAVSLMALALPHAVVQGARITQYELRALRTAADFHGRTGVAPDDAKAWMVFADPFSVDGDALLEAFSTAYPERPLVGGIASGDFTARRTHLFWNDDVYEDGAVAVAIGGACGVRTVVSQGCTPIGRAWTVTDAEGNLIRTIGGRPAYEVLVETFGELESDVQRRAAQGNIFAGLAMDEYKDEFGRGDFLVRNLIGADRESGVLAVGASVRPGQTLQFQLRDAQAADEDLRELLSTTRRELPGAPAAALLCSCNGRGAGLFGAPHHDARAVAEHLGPVPVAGFFCNGEIGPVGSRNFLHGFTASVALLVEEQAG